jgi:hypothetical protein
MTVNGPEAADPGCPLSGRDRVMRGQHLLNTSSSHSDPKATLEASFMAANWVLEHKSRQDSVS